MTWGCVAYHHPPPIVVVIAPAGMTPEERRRLLRVVAPTMPDGPKRPYIDGQRDPELSGAGKRVGV